MRWEEKVFVIKGSDVHVCLGNFGHFSDGTWTVLRCKSETEAELLLKQLKQAVADIYTI